MGGSIAAAKTGFGGRSCGQANHRGEEKNAMASEEHPLPHAHTQSSEQIISAHSWHHRAVTWI